MDEENNVILFAKIVRVIAIISLVLAFPFFIYTWFTPLFK